ncbi:TetR family transcriptional regulator [Clostridium sp. MCC353]|uniref:TetR/AcrR family transcriptional regulator n=1 Tax=Clostridium sp. MCC353 TaxID=2592646 RepID=UPI001C00AE7C|nr:TetR/AcrR family transcriptional regulator [Clostridium sp. MCC353]MBT9775933.1 TetR family transcriptional regulator [Clostridium sp. MCC353]
MDGRDNTKQDRRIRRTQKLLKDSLTQLMKEKEFKNISVKDITDRADLNRGTFYLHYTDTYHLLQQMENEVLEDFQEMINCYGHSFKRDTMLPVLTPILDYIEENMQICKILFENNAANDFVDRFHSLIRQNGLVIIKDTFPAANDAVVSCFFEFVTYGLIGLIKQWIDMGMVQPKEKLAELADKAVMGTAYNLLEIR